MGGTIEHTKARLARHPSAWSAPITASSSGSAEQIIAPGGRDRTDAAVAVRMVRPFVASWCRPPGLVSRPRPAAQALDEARRPAVWGAIPPRRWPGRGGACLILRGVRRGVRSVMVLAALAILLGAWAATPCNGCASCRPVCGVSTACHNAGPEVTGASCCTASATEANSATLSRPCSPLASSTVASAPSPRPAVALGGGSPVELARPPLRAIDRGTLFSTLQI